MQQEASKETVQYVWRERGWALWLIPKRAGLAISALYVSIPILFFYYSPLLLTDELHGIRATLWLREVLIIGAVLFLLAIDRVEYWFYGEKTPARVAVFLLGARIILIEFIAQLDTFRSSPFLYLIVPFLAVLYFGNIPGYCLAGLAWGVYILKHMLNSPGGYSDPVELQYFVTFSVGLVFVITLAQVVVRE